MTPDQIRAAADVLVPAWNHQSRLNAIPEACRPASRGDGYAVQSAAAALTGDQTVGWKIAATSSAGQKHLNVDGPLAGRLLSSRVQNSGASVVLGNNGMCVAEAEFAFRLGRDLPARSEPYTLDEVLAAIESLHPGIEVPDSRYNVFTQVGAAQLIADNACGYQYVLGPAATCDWRTVDLSQHTVQAFLDGKHDRDGTGANVLGDPRLAMVWIANELSAQGIGMQAGQVVTTGTAIIPVPVQLGSHLRADFGILGQVETRIV